MCTTSIILLPTGPTHPLPPSPPSAKPDQLGLDRRRGRPNEIRGLFSSTRPSPLLLPDQIWFFFGTFGPHPSCELYELMIHEGEGGGGAAAAAAAEKNPIW